ncbi:unnamed protein product [Lota lota]
MEMAVFSTFKRLFEYITGANENGTTIEMTAPVIIKSKTTKGWFERCNYTMSFLLPSEYQMNPPKPTNTQVYISEEPDMKVYVKSYGGLMISSSHMWNTRDLTQTLNSVGAKYDKDFHFAVGYDSPMKIFNRHNEVWFVATGEPVCPVTTA